MAPPKKSKNVQPSGARKNKIKQPNSSSGQNIKKNCHIDEKYPYSLPLSECHEVVTLEDPIADHQDPRGKSPELETRGMNFFMVIPQSAEVTSEILHVTTNVEVTTTNAIATTQNLENNQESPEGEELEDEGDTWHNRMKSRDCLFKCELCDYSTHKKYLLQRHMNSHSDIRLFTCRVCERRFKTAIALKYHHNTHTRIKPHNCANCDSSFTTSSELVRHVRYMHSNDKPHKCAECDYASVELSKLRRHMRCHTGERPFQCTECTYASPDNFKLKRHMRTHTGERPYKCTDCKMSFSQSNMLKVHMKVHDNKEKPAYACELCLVTCGRMPDLRIHMQRQHTAVKPIKCKKCPKTFPDKYTYKTHLKTHKGEMLKCTYCTYETTNIRALRSHILKHIDEKPFACDQCEQCFRQKQLLRRHQNVNHNPDYVPAKPKDKPHKCDACKRSYAHKGNYLRHLASHQDGNKDLADGTNDTRVKRESLGKSLDSGSESTEDSDQTVSENETLMKPPSNPRRGKLVNSRDLEVVVNHRSDDGGQQETLEIKGARSKKIRKYTSTVTSASIKSKANNNCFRFDEGEDIEKSGDVPRTCATK